MHNGQVVYPAPQNICTINLGLNIAKHKLAPLCLPLVGLWLRALPEPDFRAGKAVWSWTYVALENNAVMGKIFHCTLSHRDRIAKWELWDKEKQRAVLEHPRTGVFCPIIKEELAKWILARLFFPQKLRVESPGLIDWANVYRWLVRIAAHYGLTRVEFDHLCTIPAPASETGRVFYPFYTLSMPQAKAMSWGWASFRQLAFMMLYKLRTRCNRHAEGAGHGEP